MRKYIVIALVLLVSGLVISLYLIPTQREVAGMQQADMQAIDLNKVDVEAEYNAGRRSYPIVAALADKKAAANDRAGAIKILEEFVTANPNDINGRKNWPSNIRPLATVKAITSSWRPSLPPHLPRKIYASFRISTMPTKNM
jgi:hypothetical protein